MDRTDASPVSIPVQLAKITKPPRGPRPCHGPLAGPRSRRYDWLKAAADTALALALFLLTLPLFLLAAVLVKLTLCGPIIYTQARLGQHGWPYFIYKVRTCTTTVKRSTGPCWSTKGDAHHTHRPHLAAHAYR